MAYFDDLKVITGRHVPGCRVHVKSAFPDFYTVEYIHAGRLYWRVDGGMRHVLERPALFWHMPGKIYEYGPADEATGWDHHYLVLRGTRARRLVQDGFAGLSGEGFVFVAQPEAVREIFLRLLSMLNERAPGMQAESVILLERLLQMVALSPAPSPGWHTQAILELAERMRVIPFAAYQESALAREFNVCPGHFRRLFRRHCGQSFYDYLLHCRMRQAAVWLEDTDLSVKEAADRAGYADPAQFTKLFKKQIGLSPRQYRATLQFGDR